MQHHIMVLASLSLIKEAPFLPGKYTAMSSRVTLPCHDGDRCNRWSSLLRTHNPSCTHLPHTQVSLGLCTSDEIGHWYCSPLIVPLISYTQGGKEMPSERCSGTELQDTIPSCQGFPGGSAGKESPYNEV